MMPPKIEQEKNEVFKQFMDQRKKNKRAHHEKLKKEGKAKHEQ